MKIANLKTLADLIAAGDHAGAIERIEALLAEETGRDWNKYLRQLADVLAGGGPRLSIFAKDGNGKLPFLAFSSLPGEGFCPGAGDCLTFCYSFRAWRYPAAFARQAQNSVLQQTADGRAAILAALDKFAPADGIAVDFRLFVDGDFGSVSNVAYWMGAIADRPWLRAYGYSKSWRELLQYAATDGASWPENYRLNLSSGSRHSDAIKRAVAALPITRGEFIAVSMGHKVKAADHGDRAHQKALRETFGGKAFTCPGKCGDCTPKGHACGSDRFAGIPVIIAVH